ncbi:MAG: alpha-2-macroglobulin, partial [Actinomycetota bacterium]
TLDPKRAPAVAERLLASSFPGRARLSAYGLALLSLALKNGGKGPEARLCMQNLENTAKIDKEAGTCSWRGIVGRAWDWHNNDVETAAACLRAFQAIEPKHRLAPLVVRWLANNRSGAAWSSTRDTAHSVYALAEYVSKQKELAPDYTVTVDVSGRQQKKFRVTTQNALTFDNRLVIPSSALGSGAREITITREGQGNVYFTASLRVYTLEEGIQGAGNELRVRRRYFRLTRPAEGEKPETTKDGYVRTAVSAGDQLNSGDLMEVELLIESKNTYEHLVFEDMKPAGCEPVEVRSGTRFGDRLCSNVELRDDRVAFFITRLPQGKRLLSYRMRAETPGAFHALPLIGYAMYVPRVRCISDEGNLRIEDASTGDRTAGSMLGTGVK